MIKEALIKIVNKEDLTYDEAFAVMTEIMTGQTSATQNAAFLAALTTKSSKAETISEIVGCAAAMRAQAISVPNELDLIDIVGTGGDGSNSFNISTTAALICTAGGVKVAKHGNRAASSKCGTADCLQTLGVNIELTPEQALEALEQDGFCFFFAQKYHPAMKYVGAIRKELGFRTVFNILGPLTNPARPKRQLLGVYDESLVELLARVLQDLGVERGMVVYGQNRMDEITAEEYTLYRSQYLEQEQELKARLKEIEKKLPKKEEENGIDSPWIKHLLDHGEIKELTREIIQETIKSIVVYGDKRIEITYLFSEEYDRLMQSVVA